MAMTGSRRTGEAAAHSVKSAIISSSFPDSGATACLWEWTSTAARSRFSCGWIARPRISTSLLRSCIGPYGVPGHLERAGGPGLDVRFWHLWEQAKLMAVGVNDQGITDAFAGG